MIFVKMALSALLCLAPGYYTGNLVLEYFSGQFIIAVTASLLVTLSLYIILVIDWVLK